MHRSRPVSGFVIALAVGGLLLAGCGGGGTSKAGASATSSTSTTAANARSAEAQKYRDCLKQHGVDLPNFGGGAGAGRSGNQADGTTGSSVPRTRPSLPPGVDQQTFQAAQQACESLRPTGAFGGQGGARNNPAFRAYVSCLADHGVAVSTTTSTSTASGNAQPTGREFDRNDPHFAAANQVCMALLPQPSTTTTTAKSS